MYINCKIYYSFRYGTFSTEQLILTAVEKGVTSLALTNINSTCNLWEFVRLCNQHHIKPIAGVEVRNEDTFLYLLLARNLEGLQFIHEFLSKHLVAKKHFPVASENPSFFNDLSDGFVIYPFGSKRLQDLKENERIGIRSWDLNQMINLDWKSHKNKLVLLQPVSFQNKTYFNLHRLLCSIKKNCLLSKLPVESQGDEREIFASPTQLLQAFKEYPLR